VGAALPFTGPRLGLAIPNITRSSTSLALLKVFFTNLLMLILVEKNNRYEYCHHYYDSKGDGNPASKDVTLEEKYLFLALILKMDHNQRDTLKEYWSRDPMCHAPFYSQVIRSNRFFHILRFLHFENDKNAPDRDAEDYDRLWKLRSFGLPKFQIRCLV
jgi:hypothetical protein